MRAADGDLLMVPGWFGADPDHWMQRWAAKLSTARVLEPGGRAQFDRTTWVGTVATAAQNATRPAVLIGHARGVATIIEALHTQPQIRTSIVGLFLVAPADPVLSTDLAGTALPGEMPPLTPAPPQPLGMPALVIASRTDPSCPYERAEALADEWGATLVDAGDAGSIDTASGHGPWPEGVMQLAGFLRGIALVGRH